MSRIWRLDTGENVLEIERDYEYESRRGLPIQVRGRILDNNEIVENINVATTDVLLYEIHDPKMSLNKNNGFALIPKNVVDKQRKKRGEHLLRKDGHPV